MINKKLIDKSLKEKPIKKFNNKYYFRIPDSNFDIQDSFDKLKYFFKKYDRFYYFIVDILSPAYFNKKPLNRFVKKNLGLSINIGSGNQKRFKNTTNLDLIDYKNVDIVCDIKDLPFKDESINSVINLALLEHVKNPKKVILEIIRVLKPKGRVFSVIPFIAPFHASPIDYHRYTLPGAEQLFEGFNIIESGVYSGPISGFLWVLQETIASTISFGNNNLRNFLTIFLMLTTWPLKFLDIFFMHLPTAKNVSCCFYVIAEKN